MKTARLVGPVRVAFGILSSRVLGLVREAAIAFAFGTGPHGDVFSAVMRGPNLLQSLLGEQTLSASFIPVYSRMIEEGREAEAGRLAGAIFGLLLATAAALALLGILFAEPIVAFMTPGFLRDAAQVAAGEASVDRYALAVKGIRILFPMTGFLVLSAWALGVLNSHRKFFLPYFAPVLWNTAIIIALVGGWFWGGGGSEDGGLDRLLLIACVGALLGGLLQFLVQMPAVLGQLEGFKVTLSTRVAGVREALRAFLPMLGARGAVQVSAYLDQVLASMLATGAIVGMRYSAILYLLPFALFGASVAAAELPELARRRNRESSEEVRERTVSGLRQIAFLIIPTAIGYLTLGFFIVGAVYRRGNFNIEANWLVYLILSGYSLGLLASSWSRLLQNVYYAHGETKVPAATSVVRLAVSVSFGVALMLWLDAFSVGVVSRWAPQGGALRLGGVGLALAASLGAWTELALLRFRSTGRLPAFRLPWSACARMAVLSGVSLLPAGLLLFRGPSGPLWLWGPVGVVSYALTYLIGARLMNWTELNRWLGRVRPATSGGNQAK